MNVSQSVRHRLARHRGRAAALALLLAATVAAAPARGQAPCVGDCDGNGTVAINELIIGVNIALGNSDVSACPVFDTDDTGAVEIYELIAAVGNAINGCTAGPPSKANKSGPIAITPDGDTVVAVNTDVDTVTIFTVNGDGSLTLAREVEVGREPRSVALLPNGNWAYVANTVDGTVSVINLIDYSTHTITVGTEPYAAVASPNGVYIYVANASSNSVTVILTESDTVLTTIPVGRSPRALAVSNDGDNDDLDERIFVTNFFGRARAGFTPPSTADLGGTDGAAAAFPAGSNGQPVVGEGIFDDSREGVVEILSATSNAKVGEIVLGPVAQTGFNVARGGFVNSTPGDAPRTIFADGGTDGTQPQATGAFPNLLQSVILFGDRGFVPNSAASPEPPLRFNANVQSLVSVFSLTNNQEIADQTFNLNRGINFDLPPNLLEAQIRDNTDRLFPSVPVDIDCSEATNACWVVSQGSDFIVRMTFDGTGKPTINAPTAAGPFPTSPVTRILTIDPANATSSGRNPRGIAIDPDGTYAYVVCPTTRDVVVADLINNNVVQRIRSAALPTSDAELQVLRGKIDFFTSRPFWSDRGWGGCASCHPDGRTDTVTWSFEAGPRQTISLDGTFDKLDDEDQRALNWSPVRDENEDFELNTRGVFGGRGFITTMTDVNTDGIIPDSDPNVRNFGPASGSVAGAPRSPQQDDITAFVATIRSPIAPPTTTGNAARGRTLFGSGEGNANCVACHSGAKWTTSRVTYDQERVNPVPGTDTGIVNTPEADAVFINAFNSANGAGRLCEVPEPPGYEERVRIVRGVGTFVATNPIELRSNALSPVNTVAPMLAVNPAFGGDGFNSPSLLGVFESAPYLRTGAIATLEHLFGIGTPAALLPAVQAHWRAGTGGQPNVLDSDNTAAPDLVAFVKTIDGDTEIFAAADLAPNDPTFADAAALCDCAKDPPVGTPALDCTP